MAKKYRENKARKAIQEQVQLSLTPMIDVTFLILIFFMCTLKFKTLEGKLISHLPTNKGLSSAKEEVQFEDAEIILQVPAGTDQENWKRDALARRVVFKRNGSNEPFGESLGVEIDPRNPKLASFKLSPPDTLDKIREYLKTVREKSPESKAKINAFSRTPHVYVVTILNLIMEAQFGEISYSGIPDRLIQELMTGQIK